MELKKNNAFNLDIKFGKNSNTITGKYVVNDNNISLEYNGHNDIYTNGIVSGKVEGSMITFSDKNGQKVIFKK